MAVGTLSVSELYAILRGRWVQENGVHHQVHRWGVNQVNQLDGRATVPCEHLAIAKIKVTVIRRPEDTQVN